MPKRYILIVLILLVCVSTHAQRCYTCPSASDSIIFCDDFESDEPVKDRYFGYNDDEGEFIRLQYAGRDSSYGMRVKWQKGEVDAGGLQKFFGRSPYSNKPQTAFPQQDFREIYWRLDVKFEKGWEGGGGNKLSRATSLVSSKWNQGMIAHIWAGGGDTSRFYLVMDPASGITKEGELVSRHYNDFQKLRWLGNRMGNIPLFNDAYNGRWNCVVAHARLNTPGKSDGVFEFWVNDTLQAARYDLNWHGDWNSNPEHYMINAVFFENWWNDGSPVEQERYFDNIVIATKPIRCSCAMPVK